MYRDEFNNIKVPDNVTEYMKSGIKKAQVEAKSNKWLKGKTFGKVAAAIVACTLVVGVTNPAFAKELPILKEIFKYFEENGKSPQNDLSQNAKSLNISQESNGVKFTIEEVTYDGYTAYVSYRIDNKEAFPYKDIEALAEDRAYETKDGQIVNPKYEKQQIKGISLNTKYDMDCKNKKGYIQQEYAQIFSKSTIINDNTLVGIMTFDIPKDTKQNVQEKFNINMSVNYISLPPEKGGGLDYFKSDDPAEEEYSMSGLWEFNIPIEIDKSLVDVIDVNEEKDGFKLERVIVTPYHIEAKVVPLNSENQQNMISPDGMVSQLQKVYIYGQSRYQYAWTMPQDTEHYVKEGDIEGTSYALTYKQLELKEEYYTVEVQDFARVSESGTKESQEPKVIKFDTKIYPKK